MQDESGVKGALTELVQKSRAEDGTHMGALKIRADLIFAKPIGSLGAARMRNEDLMAL